MFSETINILCATDNNYAPYCGIMLTSLFNSNKDCHFVVYIFEDGSVEEANVKKYHRLAKKYGNEIVLKAIDEAMVKGFPINENLHITLPTYYRLLAADLLPKDIHKIVYLDCDIVVKGDIKPLWKVDLEGMVVAGVKDYLLSKIGRRWRLDTPSDYINAGVMVMDLDLRRKESVSGSVVDFLWTNRDNQSKVYYMDQDALNAILYDKKQVLPERFNYQVDIFNKDHWMYYTENQRSVFVEEGKNVSIIHYLGFKPWRSKKCYGPFYYEWEKARRRSLWRDCRIRIPLTEQVKYTIKRAFFRGYLRQQTRTKWFAPDELCLFPF